MSISTNPYEQTLICWLPKQALAACALEHAHLLHHDSVVALKGGINVHVCVHECNFVDYQSNSFEHTALLR